MNSREPELLTMVYEIQKSFQNLLIHLVKKIRKRVPPPKKKKEEKSRRSTLLLTFRFLFICLYFAREQTVCSQQYLNVFTIVNNLNHQNRRHHTHLHNQQQQ